MKKMVLCFPQKGYILLDVLIGVFIFGLGFGVFWGLLNYSQIHGTEAQIFISAVNMASSTMDELSMDLKENPEKVSAYLQNQEESCGPRFNKVITARWGDIPGTVELCVEIHWQSLAEDHVYKLESLFYVEK